MGSCASAQITPAVSIVPSAEEAEAAEAAEEAARYAKVRARLALNAHDFFDALTDACAKEDLVVARKAARELGREQVRRHDFELLLAALQNNKKKTARWLVDSCGTDAEKYLIDFFDPPCYQFNNGTECKRGDRCTRPHVFVFTKAKL